MRRSWYINFATAVRENAFLGKVRVAQIAPVFLEIVRHNGIFPSYGLGTEALRSSCQVWVLSAFTVNIDYACVSVSLRVREVPWWKCWHPITLICHSNMHTILKQKGLMGWAFGQDAKGACNGKVWHYLVKSLLKKITNSQHSKENQTWWQMAALCFPLRNSKNLRHCWQRAFQGKTLRLSCVFCRQPIEPEHLPNYWLWDHKWSNYPRYTLQQDRTYLWLTTKSWNFFFKWSSLNTSLMSPTMLLTFCKVPWLYR